MLRRHIYIISIQRSAYICAEMRVTTFRRPRCVSLFQGSIVDQNFGRLMAFESLNLSFVGTLNLPFCQTGRYCLCGRLCSTAVLIYISLSNSNRKFRYAMLLL